jgi:uncharacterized membrane-anchored protein YhcB (DUF1043 family)
MNARLLYLLVGLAVGAVVGYLTRPEAAEIKLGPLQMEVQTNQTAEPGGAITSSQWQHIFIFAGIGAVVGFAAGAAVTRRGA